MIDSTPDSDFLLSGFHVLSKSDGLGEESLSASLKAQPRWSADLNAVRGSAAVFVVLEHLRRLFFVSYAHATHKSHFLQLAYGLCGLGSPAVMVFFVLSGYFITGSIFRMRDQNTWSWSIYSVHRLVRLNIVLLPALLITAFWDSLGLKLYGHSAAYLATGDLSAIVRIPIETHDTLPIWLGNAFFLQGILSPVFGSNTPLWSLSYEFWYYVLFPVILLIFARGETWTIRVVYTFLAVAIGMLIGHTILMYFAVWLMGSTVAALERRGLTMCVGNAGKICIGAIFVCAVTVAHIKGTDASNYWFSLVISLAFAAWLSATLSSKVDSDNKAAPLQSKIVYNYLAKALADRSYTLYLVHVPLLFFICAAILPQGKLWQPDMKHVLMACGILIAVLTYAFLIWQLTEVYTDRVRAMIEKALNRRNPK